MCSMPTEYVEECARPARACHRRCIELIERSDDQRVGLRCRSLQFIRRQHAIIGIDPDVVTLPQLLQHRLKARRA